MNASKIAQIVFMVANGSLLGYAMVGGGRAAPIRHQPKPHTKVRDAIDYNRDIRPILSNKCFTCHGHDPKQIRGNLRLDTAAGATAKLPNGKIAVVPGHPERSYLIAKVEQKNEDLRMPPPGSNKTLNAEEIGLLKRWIAEGGQYKEHWAFVAPVRPSLPAVELKSWPKNSIDYFVLAELEKRGLKPSPEAEKATLLRRVSLDITGLPPSPQELDAFLKDRSPKAYEKVVDRLLASPRYGERMAMDWMDYSRYADSNGYQSDWERYQWRWRDWVINAYNANMPYDQFTVKQIAGDLLPHPTLEDRIATGFNRNNRINTEGGVIAEEWRVEGVIDRVETTSAIWLGLTTGCARCHDHKYDPIKQKDFYSMYAYFNNVPETGTGEERPVNHPPFIKAPYPAQESKYNSLKAQVEGLDSSLHKLELANADKAQDWKVEGAEPPASLSQGVVARYSLGPSTQVTAGEAPMPKPMGAVKHDPGRSTGAAITDANDYLDLGKVGDFDAHKPFSYALWVNPKDGSGSPISHMDSGQAYRGWDLYMDGGKPAVHVIDTWPTNAMKIVSKAMLPNNEWSHVAITYDGSSKASGLHIYVNGKLSESSVETDQLTGNIHTDVTAKIGRRTNSDMFNGMVDDVGLYARALAPNEVESLANVNRAKALAAIPVAARTTDQKALLARMWSKSHDSEYQKLESERARFGKEFETLDASIPTVMIMEEMPKPRPAFVLVRGQYDKHGDAVSMRLPTALPPMPKGAPNNRLGLAEWLVSPTNPLMARVTVNRFWARFFGVGIVATVEDFGTRAEFPSHPELLDWLATEFMRKRWDVKAMLKEIAMSATYRQDSRITAHLEKIDPANRLLARGPRFRLQAEVIRDQAMFAGGMLAEKIGGPGVHPYQPDGIWDETSSYGNLHNYKHDTNSDLHRRSLYTIWKRTAAPPIMTLFDVPARETCRMFRSRTDTPLQALALLNDVTYVESARALAQRAIATAPDSPDSRIDFMYRAMLCRNATPAELKILKGSLQKWTKRYDADRSGATYLLGIGDYAKPKKMDVAELAAYTVVASTILNLDEAITKD